MNLSAFPTSSLPAIVGAGPLRWSGPGSRGSSDQGPIHFGTGVRGVRPAGSPSCTAAEPPHRRHRQDTEIGVPEMTRRNLTTTVMVVSAALLLFGGVALAHQQATREDLPAGLATE